MLESETAPNTASSSREKIEWTFLNLIPLMILLTYLMMGGHIFFNAEGDYHAEGAFGHQMILSLCFFLGFLILLRERKKAVEILKANWLLFLFLLYALISCAWSPAPFVSFKRWIQFLGIIFVGMAAISGVSGVKSVVGMFRTFTAASLSLSFFFTLIKPSYPFMIVPGVWNGLYNHKNLLGAACVLALAIWLPAVLNKSNKTERRNAIFMILLSFLLLFLSKSATSLIVSLLLLIVFSVVALRMPIVVKTLLIPIPILVIYLLIVNLTPYSPMEFILSIVGRDTTFTGRTDLWAAVMDSIVEHPYFGVGYNGFWVGEFSEAAYFTASLTWERMTQAHNGYLDIINELGIVGFGIFLTLLGQSIFRGCRFLKRNREYGLIFLLIIIVSILSNFMESSFCRLVTLMWLTFLVTHVAMTPNRPGELDISQVKTAKNQVAEIHYA